MLRAHAAILCGAVGGPDRSVGIPATPTQIGRSERHHLARRPSEIPHSWHAGSALVRCEQAERRSGVSSAIADHVALTPPGCVIRIASKTLLKTGAWEIRWVLSIDLQGVQAITRSWRRPQQPDRITTSQELSKGRQPAAPCFLRVACGAAPLQPKGQLIDRGMGLARWLSDLGIQTEVLQESER